MKKILLLSPFFYPEPISTGKYNAILAKELVLEDHDVEVVCSHPIYPSWKVEQTTDELDKVKTHRGGKYLRFPKNVLIRRSVLEVWFFFHVLFSLIKSNRYDCIIPIFPPSLFMLIVPFLTKRVRILGIIHDLQGVYASNNAGIIKKAIFSCIKYVETKAFSSCDKLIFLSENMQDVACEQYGINRNKCSVHYPFVTIKKFVNQNNLSSIIPDGKASLVYSGALGDKQAPEQLASFMDAFVEKNTSASAYIFSQGTNFEELKEKYRRIHFHPLVEEKDLPELLLRSSIQILPQAEGTSDGSLPSKLPNLLASGCKILCITDEGSELVRILKSYSKSEVVTKWDNKKLIARAETLLEKDKSSVTDEELLSKFRLGNLVNLF